MVVAVVFKGNLEGKKYHYLVKDFHVKPKDEVLVPVGNYGHVEVATVVATWLEDVDYEYSSIPSFDLKEVIAPANSLVLLHMMRREIDGIEQKYKKLLSKLG